ncbi:phage terminase, small subunit, putative, P27 family [Ruminococcus flavefaciens]|uniref:P27 family predicted phage terminase small subunit n=1 Tax=Ruminococcus flavefaciens TaxID=1265 RepID=A0A315Y0Y1_RUMFL|nr:P27 family predicted phage terminase small subunit [Ruminococcus flavefaciens]SSA43504.1 phage terminase, small subunit, putative, P27 family [Ruminococcus flavefaciens]
MARPCKNVKLQHDRSLDNDEAALRLSNENKLKGDAAQLRPPKYMTTAQKKIFRYIVKNLEAAEILGNLDVYVLSECSICIDRMQEIERTINEAGSIIPSLVRLKETYTKAFFRYCNELSLSPQSRAKLANINLQASNEENPLIKALMDDE